MDLDKFKEKKKKPNLKYKKRKTKRTIVKQFADIPQKALQGIVHSIIGTNLIIEDSQGSMVECVTGGIIVSINENQTLVTVGDRVLFTPPDKESESQKGVIVKVEERKNHFSRKAIIYENEDVIAANIDKLIIMMAAAKPSYNKRFMDRLLVTAELNGVEPIICINKVDLSTEEDLDDDLWIYKEIGIKIYYISAKYGNNINIIEKELENKTSVLAGPSGSGKSTLLNTLLKKDIQMVGDTSTKTQKGKHTTSAARMFNLPNGGKIIDTPGIREFGIYGLEKEELALYFHEFDDFNPHCKYYPCTHLHEPDCAVIKALEEGILEFDRYESYVNMYHTLD